MQDELEIAGRVGPGGGASHAVRCGDDHTGDWQFFLGISIALDHGTLNGHREALLNKPQPLRTLEQQ